MSTKSGAQQAAEAAEEHVDTALAALRDVEDDAAVAIVHALLAVAARIDLLANVTVR